MRERTTWSREIIASKLRKVAEDPRSMNQDHIQRQPAADAYVIGDGSPSQFAEDVNSGKGSWKSEQGSDGNTKRNEIGFPEFRGDTFNNPESSPGVTPSRQASLSIDEVHARADLATKVARIMLPKTASGQAIEDQALLLMDMPTASLKSTLSRLAQQDEGDDDEDEDDEDEGQDKTAQQDEDDEEEEGQQAKQAKDLPPEFLKNIQEKKDQAKDKDKDDDKGEKKSARARRAQDEDEKKQSQQQDKEEQSKEARARKAQQQDKSDEEAEGQDKEAADQDEDEKKQSQQQDKEACSQVGKETVALIKQAAAGLLLVPQTSRHLAFKAMLPMLMKSASQGQGLGQPVAQQQLQSQVQQLVQQAMQQQLADQQQQQVAPTQQQPLAQGQEQLPQLAQGQQQQLQPLGQDDSQALVDQLFQEPDQGQQFFASDEIQMDSPTMDIGDVSFGPEDAALNSLFASEPEVQRAIQANALRSGTTAPATTRTASTRTVGTRPTEGVSHLGGGVSSTPGGQAEEINRLSGMWSTAPDVSGVFSS